MIKIFTTPTCAYCPMAKKYLALKGKAYEELPAYTEEHQKYISIYGSTSVPMIVNGEKITTGYNIPQLNQVIA